MVCWQLLLLFGVVPLVVLLLLAPRNAWRYKGTFLWVVLAILWVSIPWEASSVERIWFYSPGTILGWRILGLSVEEYAFFVIDAATLSLLLRRGGRRADCSIRCPPTGRIGPASWPERYGSVRSCR